MEKITIIACFLCLTLATDSKATILPKFINAKIEVQTNSMHISQQKPKRRGEKWAIVGLILLFYISFVLSIIGLMTLVMYNDRGRPMYYSTKILGFLGLAIGITLFILSKRILNRKMPDHLNLFRRLGRLLTPLPF
jgi:hypothetical protein